MGKNLVVTITESEFIRMKSVVMDKDGEEALKLLKEFDQALGATGKPGFEIPFGVRDFQYLCHAAGPP